MRSDGSRRRCSADKEDGAGGNAPVGSAARDAPSKDDPVDAAVEHEEEARKDGDEDSGTIATRTRTKLSLVDVPIDTLESYLPDTVEPILGEEEDHEYQRFLSSLLPQEQENLSFLDEEDEEYEPEEEDDDDVDAATGNATERMTVKISKKELTELLWDSTRLGVSLVRVASGNTNGDAATRNAASSRMLYDRAGAITENILALRDVSSGMLAAPGTSGEMPSDPATQQDADAFASAGRQLGDAPATFPPMLFPQPMLLHTPQSFLRPSDDMHHKQYPMKEMHGKISQEQCVQLASQMHKHFQLLIQNFHLFALPTDEKMEAEEAARRMAKLGDDVTEYEAKEADPETRKQRKREALQECRKMMEELKVRGEKAQKCKEILLSKLNPSASQPNQETISSRRVTRSLTAAHAAVAHPSMFELVGSNSLDELTSKFLANCSFEERDLAIQDQMLEIDKHLLLTQKKNPKKPFTPSEDNLLAHGVKRFHLDDESWVLIEKHFLPGKKLPVIRRRFRYLTSNKTGMSAVKEYHSQFPKRRDASWILEEDLRIARGMIEFHNDSKRFARVGLKYLSHRGRLEIRKRWERIRQKFEPEITAQNPNIDDSSIDYAVLMKDLLEDKLREQVLRQSKKIVEEPPQQPQSNLPHETSQPTKLKKYVFRAAEKEYDADMSAAEMKIEDVHGQHQNQNDRSTNACQAKNLHPALFFTSWALINPSILLARTCEHNWPSFIDELSGEPKEDDAASAEVMADPTSPAADELSVTDAQGTENEHAEEQGMDEPPLRSKQCVRTPPTRKKPLQQPAAAAPTAQPKLQAKKRTPKNADSESEPSMMVNSSTSCEDEDDDDSDYEHDELVSSENDQESDSEFEQMELSDDDEDEEDHEDDDDDFEYEELDDDDDEEDNEVAAPAVVEARQQDIDPPKASTPSRSARAATTRAAPPAAASSGKKASLPPPEPSSPASLRHPLRLQNLSKPGNERMQRALEALERRIVGKSVDSSLSVADANRAAAQQPRKPATRVAFSNEPIAPGRKRRDEARHDPFRVEIQTIGLPKVLDLETDEVLAPSSGDDSFEREELSSSDDEHPDVQASAVQLDNDIGRSHSYVQDVARDMLVNESGWRPSKKPRLSRQLCGVCRNAPCVCSNARRTQHVLQQRGRPSSVSPGSPASSRKVKLCQRLELHQPISSLVTDGQEARLLRLLLSPPRARALDLFALALGLRPERVLREALEHALVLVVSHAVLRERVRKRHLAPAEQQVRDLVIDVELRTAATRDRDARLHTAVVVAAVVITVIQRSGLHGSD
ncbi:hypothetical protein FI667_g3650, partial [Globisporangium splendens]